MKLLDKKGKPHIIQKRNCNPYLYIGGFNSRFQAKSCAEKLTLPKSMYGNSYNVCKSVWFIMEVLNKVCYTIQNNLSWEKSIWDYL